MEKYLNEEAEPNSERFVPYKEFYNTRKITIGKTLDKAPFGMENKLGYGLVLFMPERAIAKICPAGIEKLMVMLYNSDNRQRRLRKCVRCWKIMTAPREICIITQEKYRMSER